jgi:signal transduction histidine kinase
VTGGVFVARRVLTRIDQMTETTRLIMAGNFSGRLTVSGTDDELDRLAQSLNMMLERIQELMKGLKEVSDNIAHDLKTPLTRLRNSAEDALRNFHSVDDLRLALDHVIEEADGLIKLFNALLMIARADAGGAFDKGDTLDLSAIAHDVVELYEPLAEEVGIKLSVKAIAPLEIRGSRELLGQALANLLDNAIKYSAAPANDHAIQANEIIVAVERKNDIIELSVADRGPGIAEADRGRVLDRFVRLETSRTRPGSGLGLSLAAAIARLHNGTLKLEDHMPGLRVVLSLPIMSKA